MITICVSDVELIFATLLPISTFVKLTGKLVPLIVIVSPPFILFFEKIYLFSFIKDNVLSPLA